MHSFHIGNKELQAQVLGNTRAATIAVKATTLGWAEARGDGIFIVGVIATWGGRCPLSIGAAVVEAAAGEAEEARMTMAQRLTTLQM
jgi:hypothetical protein